MKGTVIGTDIYGNIKKKLVKRDGKAKPDIMHFIEDADVPCLVNVKLALLDLYHGRNKIEEVS